MNTRLTTIIAGTKYTLWVVEEKMFNKTKDGYVQYVCKCKCGAKGICRGTDLHRGRTLGCKKCITGMDILGLKIGTWNILKKRTDITGNRGRHTQYDVECECGYTNVMTGTKLRHGAFPACPSCNIKKNEKISADAVTKAKVDSAEFKDRKNRAKKIYDSNIDPHLKIRLLERYLDLLQRRMSFFMIELNGDSDEFKDYCKQLEDTYNYITELKKSFIMVEPVKEEETPSGN